jgi:hypothetical protein
LVTLTNRARSSLVTASYGLGDIALYKHKTEGIGWLAQTESIVHLTLNMVADRCGQLIPGCLFLQAVFIIFPDQEITKRKKILAYSYI